MNTEITRQRKKKPAVFILESNSLTNEYDSEFEGEALSRILHLSRIESQYFYFRTKKELKELLEEFKLIKYRYLHIACHGDETSMATTFDEISFDKLAEILKPNVANRRLFFSACSMTNINLARAVFSKARPYSIMGPAQDLYFSEAAVFWAGFYTVMLLENRSMSKERILTNARNLASSFGLDFNYFGRDNSQQRGFTTPTIRRSQPNKIERNR